jgi:hypothetical protein
MIPARDQQRLQNLRNELLREYAKLTELRAKVAEAEKKARFRTRPPRPRRRGQTRS